MNFKDSEELIQEQLDKEEEEHNKTIEELSHKEDSNTTESLFRKLGWPGHFEYQWILASSNILGNDVKIYYYIELKGGSITNAIIVKFGVVSITIGNTKRTSNKMLNGKERYDDKEVAKLPFGFSGISFSFKLGVNFDYSVDNSFNEFLISYYGEIYAKAGIDIGIQNVASVEAGFKGTFLRADFFNSIIKDMEKDCYYIQKHHLKRLPESFLFMLLILLPLYLDFVYLSLNSFLGLYSVKDLIFLSFLISLVFISNPFYFSLI